MIKVFNKATGEPLGRISNAQLQFLESQLEEESVQDRDYYLTRETVDQFEKQGADPALVYLLRSALKSAQSIEIRWERDPAPPPAGERKP